MTFGSDPESMIIRLDDQKVVSAIPIIGHDKHDPIDLGDGIRLYADNVLAENSFPPTENPDDFIARLREVFVRTMEFLGGRYELAFRAAHIYDETELGPKPEIMVGKLPVEWEIGCNPSWDTYKQSSYIPNPFEDGMRTGSFHLHIGHEKLAGGMDNIEMKATAIRLLDLFVGCASVIFDKDKSSPMRRRLYGKCGDFRPTPYGIEWRTLGNYALRSPALVRLVLDLATYAMGFIDRGEHEAALEWTDPDEVQKAVNTCDKKLAKQILLDAAMPSELMHRIERRYRIINWREAWAI